MAACRTVSMHPRLRVRSCAHQDGGKTTFTTGRKFSCTVTVTPHLWDSRTHSPSILFRSLADTVCDCPRV